MKKKILASILVLCMIFNIVGCGKSDNKKDDEKPVEEQVEEKTESEEVAESEAAESDIVLNVDNEDSEEKDSSSDSSSSKATYSDRTLTTEKCTIKITDYKIIQPGDKGNEYEEMPVIAFWYEMTNNTDDMIDSYQWSEYIDAYQDNDPNIENKLEMGPLPDDQYLDTQMADIKPGGTLADAVCFVLTDETTPVTLKFRESLIGDVIAEEDFSVQ